MPSCDQLGAQTESGARGYSGRLGEELAPSQRDVTEMAPSGDPSRGAQVLINGRSGYFVQHNRGKKGICVDLKTPEGLAIVKQLILQTDVLVENFAPGVIGRLGLDYDSVHMLNPKVVMCSISAFGQNGRLANEPGFDYLGAAYAGIVSMGGEPYAGTISRSGSMMLLSGVIGAGGGRPLSTVYSVQEA